MSAPTTRTPARLSTLLSGVPITALVGPDALVDHLCADSREVGPGGLFVAARGFLADGSVTPGGHAFIAAARAAGVAAIVAETAPPPDLPATLTWAQVPDSAFALAMIAAAFHGHPARDVAVLATTGTNGKTTVSYLLYDVLRATGHRPGLLSTVELLIGSERLPTIFTTPPSPAFQALLARMRDEGCTHAVVEASSHGLHQHRMAAFEVAVGGFTNLSRDHLDYHATMAQYRAAKATLFDRLARAACFNVDDLAGAELAAAFSRGPKLTVSAKGDPAADVYAVDPTFDLDGCRATLITPAGELPLELRLIGAHNLENALVALGMLHLAGLPLADAVAALGQARGARGRLERVDGPRHVFVDYAHTPDALDSVLAGLRRLTAGRLICVFGAGGDRDTGKRPQMAAAAARHADLVVVTSDNPRTEDPAAIVADVAAGLPPAAARIVEVDRRAAIAAALAAADPDDVVPIAGKGHEDYQIIGTTRHDFSDVEVARQAMEALS